MARAEVLVKPLKHHFGEEDILSQLARCRYLGMQLPEARHGFAVEHGPRRASGMEVVRRLVVEVELVVLEAAEQLLDVALQMEERRRLGSAVHAMWRKLPVAAKASRRCSSWRSPSFSKTSPASNRRTSLVPRFRL